MSACLKTKSKKRSSNLSIRCIVGRAIGMDIIMIFIWSRVSDVMDAWSLISFL